MENNKNLQAALAYKAIGWSVIPVGKNKIPLIAWKVFQERIASDEEIEGWWKKYPNAQVGIVTGFISGLVVVDIEKGGDPSIIKDDTMTIQTGGGGWHFYFEFDPAFSNAVRIMDNVDIRSEGGYVVAPPSETEKGAYKTLKGTKPVRMSHSTKKLFTDAYRASEGVPENKQSQVYLKKEDIVYQGAQEGGRNESITSYTGMVLSRIHPSLWDTVALPLILQANIKNSPPLPQHEVLAIFKSISSRERKKNPVGRPTYIQKKDDYTDRINEDTEIEQAQVLHISEAAERQVVDSDNAFSVGMPPFDDALLGGFSPGDLIVVSGKPGMGKTTLIQNWTTVLAKGIQKKSGEEQDKLPALWFSYEVLVRPLWKKFKEINADEDTPIFIPSFNESGSVEWVEKMIMEGIKKYGVKVIAIDHQGFLKPPRGEYSNNAEAITQTVRFLKQLAVRHGLIIMLPAHVKKTHGKQLEMDDLQSSGGIAQEADAVFFIERMKDGGERSERAKIWMDKNRKTGNIASGVFDYKFGRYWYNDSETKTTETDEGAQRKREEWFDSL